MDRNYSLSNRREIADKLNRVLIERHIIEIYFHKNKKILSSILSIKDNTVEIESSVDRVLNYSIDKLDSVLIKTCIDNISMEFHADLKLSESSVFKFNMPNNVRWLQRRSYFRVKIPGYKKASLKIEPSCGANEFYIHDISVSGFSIKYQAYHHEPDIFEKNSIMTGHLILGDDNLDVQFRVASKHLLENQMQKIGCEFIQNTILIENKLNYFVRKIENDLLICKSK